MPMEVMSARKIKSAFDKFLLNDTKVGNKNKVLRKCFRIREKVYFRVFGNNNTHWETGTIDNQIGNMMYIVQD